MKISGGGGLAICQTVDIVMNCLSDCSPPPPTTMDKTKINHVNRSNIIEDQMALLQSSSDQRTGSWILENLRNLHGNAHKD